MDNVKEFEHRLTAVESRSKSNSHRIDEIVKRMEDDVKEIKKDVKELTGKSGKRWDAIVDKAILTVIGAILLCILAKLGF